MTEKQLGKLIEVDLRKIWRNEAQDFTPWLADEGLDLLGETIEVDISFEAKQVKNGDFFIDILGERSGTDEKIVIENQLDETDHDHLGKIITYSAGTDASIVIWIFREMREEHRQAIDWLNDITNENISFFALEIKLYKISESNPAPKFEIICKPNEYGKASKRPTEIQKKQKDFWAKFKSHADKQGEKDFTLGPAPRNWYEISRTLPDSIRIRLYVDTRKEDIRCEFQIVSAHSLYEHLIDRKVAIDSKLGQTIWYDDKQDTVTKIIIKQSGFDLDDESEYESYFNWFIESVKLLKETLLPYVREYEGKAPYNDSRV